MTYTIKWDAQPDTNRHHTADTIYVADGFRIWKGKFKVFSVIYSADKWNLERTSDHFILHSARTAKECKGVLEYALKHGIDPNTADCIVGGSDIVFNDDFTDYEFKSDNRRRK